MKFIFSQAFLLLISTAQVMALPQGPSADIARASTDKSTTENGKPTLPANTAKLYGYGADYPEGWKVYLGDPPRLESDRSVVNKKPPRQGDLVPKRIAYNGMLKADNSILKRLNIGGRLDVDGSTGLFFFKVKAKVNKGFLGTQLLPGYEMVLTKDLVRTAKALQHTDRAVIQAPTREMANKVASIVKQELPNAKIEKRVAKKGQRPST